MSVRSESMDENNETVILQPLKSVESYSASKKQQYYTNIHEVCTNRRLKRQTTPLIVNIISRIVPILHRFDFEIRGSENLPKDDVAVFACNHSNSHDLFIVQELFARLKRPVTSLAAWDGLNVFARTIIRLTDATFIKRDDKNSKESGILDFCTKILDGKNGFVFGEGTWNLHPILPMQRLRAGATEVALITEKVIVPTIFEYVEVTGECKKENELYSKCIIVFGEPVKVSASESIFEQTHVIQQKMEEMRKSIWQEIGVNRNSIQDINQKVYLNHVYLKKFKAIGYTFDSEYESRYLFYKGGKNENEYCINEQGEFVPGNTKK